MTAAHQDRAHAKLSASGSSQWLLCPGSINAQKAYKNESSVYAQEGTLAHEVADYCLKRKIDADSVVGKTLKELKIQTAGYEPSHEIEKEMGEHVQSYLDYVRSYETKKTKLYTEEKVDFSNVVPEGFGTMDAAVVDPEKRVCHVFDLKYGKGVPVDAFENTQGQMYAIGLLNEIGFLDEFDSFQIHIIQPRLQNYSSWEISVEDLKKFSEWVKERAALALTADAPRVPGEKQCHWCRAKGDCPALFNFTQNVINQEFDNLDDLECSADKITDEQKKLILDNASLIKGFIDAIEQEVYNQLLEGKDFNGYKLVEGRSNRQYTENAEEELTKILGERAFKKVLLGLTDAQKLVGKDKMDEITIKPPGRLTLAKDSDKRQAVRKESIEDMFDEV